MDHADLHVARLGPSAAEQAQGVFALLAEVFDEDHTPLSDSYLDRLLCDPGFWVYAATAAGELVGGLTAHSLPMTTDERDEVFLYDIAVHPARRRLGVGRLLVDALVGDAARAGIDTVFVPADNDDAHALDFYRSLGASESPVTFFDLGEG